jgi:Rrf2 family iron-sulfur cluster assembly transcriptional regulator
MKRIFSFSEASLIALHGMAVMAIAQSEQVSVKEIAKRINSSENHVSKVMQQLAKEGLVVSSRGPSGGFRLLGKPETITLFDIYRSIEGKTDADDCPFGKSECMFTECLFGDMVRDAGAKFLEHMKTKTLFDFIKK